ncbi:MAG: hypothetical protein LKE40_09630 [Spirochaetia bacterium]|jgi:membrane protein implicated in regulation of membrane protease activity|nr:hypothetical protein [Spirochaetia bacterium]
MSWTVWLLIGSAFALYGYYRKNINVMANAVAAYVAGTLVHLGLTDSLIPYVAFILVSWTLVIAQTRWLAGAYAYLLGRQVRLDKNLEPGQTQEIELDHKAFRIKSITGQKLKAGARTVIVAVKGSVALVKAVDEG